MMDLHRNLAGVALHVGTNDPAKATKVRRLLDAMQRAFQQERRSGQDWLMDFVEQVVKEEMDKEA